MELGSYTTKEEAIRRRESDIANKVGIFMPYRIRKIRVRWGSRQGKLVYPPQYAYVLEREY